MMEVGPKTGRIIPHDALEKSTLRRVIEEFVTREGTEYGTADVALDDKVDDVLHQIEKGEAVITFDEESGSISITPARDL